jgi:hypothetical protein
MNSMAGVLIFAGIAIVLVGLLWLGASRLGLGRLPGDIAIERDNVRVYAPIVSMIVLSIILTIVLNVALRLWR